MVFSLPVSPFPPPSPYPVWFRKKKRLNSSPGADKEALDGILTLPLTFLSFSSHYICPDSAPDTRIIPFQPREFSNPCWQHLSPLSQHRRESGHSLCTRLSCSFPAAGVPGWGEACKAATQCCILGSHRLSWSLNVRSRIMFLSILVFSELW